MDDISAELVELSGSDLPEGGCIKIRDTRTSTYNLTLQYHHFSFTLEVKYFLSGSHRHNIVFGVINS